MLLTYLQYLPAVLGAAYQVEQVMIHETGETKKKLVIDSLQAAMKAANLSIDSKILVLIATLIDSVVATLNALNVFRHKGQTT